MAMTVAEASILVAGTVVASGGTEAVPLAAGVGTVVGPFADYASSFAYRINNSSPAPTTALTIVFYGIANGRYYEVDRVSGDTVVNSAYSGVIPCPAGFSQFTAKAFGNTPNPVTVEVYLERQVP